MHETVEDDYNGRDTNARSQHIANISAITKGLPAWLLDTQDGESNRRLDPRVPGTDDTNTRIKYLIATLSLLHRTYPLHGASFESLQEIRPWLSDAQDVLQRTTASLDATKGYVETIVARAAKDWEGGIQEARAELRDEGKEGTPEAAMLEFAARVANPRNQLDELSDEFSDLLVEIESIDADVGRYDGNAERLPSRQRVAIVFAATLLAFIAGVMLPLINTDTPRWIYVGFPCAIYACGVVVAALYIGRLRS